MIVLIIRTLIVFLLLNAALRLTGKRQIGELDLSELITTLLISEIASSPITSPNVPILHAVVPIFIIASLEVIVTFFTSRSMRLKEIIDGTPSIIIRNGVIDQTELQKQRISAKDLLVLLRQSGIGDPAEVKYAILEEDGKLSVFPVEAPPGNIVYALVVEGEICRGGIKLCGKDENWIRKRLAFHRVKMKDVYLFAINDEKKETLIRKTKKK